METGPESSFVARQDPIETTSTKKVLVIDDSQSIAKMFVRYFRLKGVTCVVTNDGMAGLRLIESQDFTHILLDLSTPNFSGYDVLGELIKKNTLLRKNVSVLTAGSLSTDDTNMLIQEGVLNFIRKPIRLDTLLEIIGVAA